MKNKLPAIKVYDIDYSFIIKNYLNPEMWKKTWTLFVYKTFVVTMHLSSINCQDEKVWFGITIKDNSDRNYRYEWGENIDKATSDSVDYSLKINDISFLKTAINNTIIKMIECLETYAIRGTNEYNDIKKSCEHESKILEDIAIKFLDSEGVSNKDIRDAYIDSYISQNTKMDVKLGNFISELKCSILPDFYLIFARATGDKRIIGNIEYHIRETNINSNEFIEEMQDCLEEI